MEKNIRYRIRKICSPSANHLLARERLFALLDSQDKNITWISGPPGAGKTALVSSWLNVNKRAHLWYQLDERDNTLDNFFHYLNLATPTDVEIGKITQHDTSQFLNYFETLYQQLELPFVLVFDDYHHIQHPLFHKMLSCALETLPENIQIIIMSRNRPPASFARWLTHSQFQHIGCEQLGITLDETINLANQYGQFSLNTLQYLHTLSEYWILGLLLMLKNASHHPINKQYCSPPKSREIFNYFACEVFDKVQPETQQFLLRTCFVPDMTISEAEQLSGMQCAGKTLRYLHEQSYFTMLRYTNEVRYAYHPLFADFLQTRAKNSLTTQVLIELQQTITTLNAMAGHKLAQPIEQMQLGNQNKTYTIQISVQENQVAISRNNQPIRFTGKQPRKSLALLHVLIEHGGIAVPANKLADILWPDSDGDSAHMSFKYTLHNLRKLLGSNETLKYSDGKLSINPDICYIDRKS